MVRHAVHAPSVALAGAAAAEGISVAVAAAASATAASTMRLPERVVRALASCSVVPRAFCSSIFTPCLSL
ncbi:hypothetical protein GCM10010275_15410 [Streptomyces litmocidini]|nr:hypothetical protein GCM10010275_15410 [Streptomyces litmocidini]